MLKCVLVPDAILVEDEDLEGLGVAEAHLRVEDSLVPHEGRANHIRIYFLEVLDVDVDAADLTH